MQLVSRQRSAQSLLEAILAIGVILTATISATTLIVTTITTGQVSKDNIQAANFAREGVEIIRGIRDSNWLRRQQNISNTRTTTTFAYDDNPYTTGPTKLAPAVGLGSTTWVVVWNATNNRFEITDSGNQALAHPNGQSYFTQNCTGTCTNSKFSRTITITRQTESTDVGAVEYLNVVTTVSWTGHAAKPYSITERLYDWR